LSGLRGWAHSILKEDNLQTVLQSAITTNGITGSSIFQILRALSNWRQDPTADLGSIRAILPAGHLCESLVH
jgi:hypothetical protein